MTDDNTFEIPSWNIDRLNSEIAKLNRRAAKIGCPPIEVETLGDYERVAPGYEDKAKILGFENVPHITIHFVEVRGEGPKIEGWKFIGSLDHVTLPGSVIVNTVPGETIPTQYHNKAPVCDHCGAERRRNDTFVLENEEGDYKQVGRMCLRDFFGHDPSVIARFLERIFKFVGNLSDEEEWFGGGGPTYYTYEHEKVLATTAAIIRHEGWVPRLAAGYGKSATADLVLGAFTPPYGGKELEEWKKWKESLDLNNPKFKEDAEGARAWLKEQDDTNEYMHNLHMIDQAGAVPTRLFGYWCSLVAAYQRSQERLRLQQAQRKLNEHFGKLKERVEIEAKIISIRSFDGAYGVVHLVRMHDNDGRTAVWFANTRVEMSEGFRYRIKGTIKKHDEYKGWKQTVLNRVTVLEELSNECADDC